jgi:hypothetical protein
MISLAKRIAMVIDTFARPQGGVAQMASQGVVLVLAASMALCTARLSLRDAGREEALLRSAHALSDDSQGIPS